jgi:disulfide oxidoreductase YuzD
VYVHASASCASDVHVPYFAGTQHWFFAIAARVLYSAFEFLKIFTTFVQHPNSNSATAKSPKTDIPKFNFHSVFDHSGNSPC